MISLASYVIMMRKISLIYYATAHLVKFGGINFVMKSKSLLQAIGTRIITYLKTCTLRVSFVNPLPWNLVFICFFWEIYNFCNNVVFLSLPTNSLVIRHTLESVSTFHALTTKTSQRTSVSWVAYIGDSY